METNTNKSRIIAALRWLAVLPTFIFISALVSIGWFFLVYLTLRTSYWLNFVGFYAPPDPNTFMRFHTARDMNGEWIDGTIWLLLKYSIGCAVGMKAALGVAPAHKVKTGWSIFALTGIALLFCLSFELYIGASHSFSNWYRSIIEAMSIIGGCWFGLKKVNDNASA